MLGSLDNFRRQSAAFGLVCALWLVGGCAAVQREPGCGCPDCQTGQGYAGRTGDINVVGKFTNDFHNLVIGSEDEAEAPETGPEPVTSRPKRQVASSKPSSKSSSKPKPRVVEAEQVAMTTGPTTSEVVGAPEAVMAAPAAPSSEPCMTVDNGGCAPGPLVSGPAGRFFPVPAWPVFSPPYGPPYGPQSGGCELR
ncbi:hypothetical protein [Aeoliella sp. SH292]|uniref:hypothetical protein n=1 Tax=Aeoliella sp. SH292 TaxID=3454464 RepID=UPI003F972DBC